MTTSDLPSIDLVRQLTDRHVLRQLIDEAELTRAELAARTAISKPTISESIRRLQTSNLVAESGKQSGKRGPSGTYFRLRNDAGYALTVSIGPGGVIAETSGLWGDTLHRVDAHLPGPVTSIALLPVLRRVVDRAIADLPGRAISACVNVAGPVDQRTQHLVRLPNSPYFVDDFDPAQSFRDLVDGAVQIDNDVNWTAAAEHAEGRAVDVDDFLYAYLGSGIGSAIYAGGALVRGHRGLAGELANVLTQGPDGRTRRLADCFADWGLRVPGTEAIDVAAITATVTGESGSALDRREQIARAVSAALGSLAAALDPETILVGGPWATAGLCTRIGELVAADAAARATVQPAALGADAAHRGARRSSVRRARERLLQRVDRAV